MVLRASIGDNQFCLYCFLDLIQTSLTRGAEIFKVKNITYL